MGSELLFLGLVSCMKFKWVLLETLQAESMCFCAYSLDIWRALFIGTVVSVPLARPVTAHKQQQRSCLAGICIGFRENQLFSEWKSTAISRKNIGIWRRSSLMHLPLLSKKVCLYSASNDLRISSFIVYSYLDFEARNCFFFFFLIALGVK